MAGVERMVGIDEKLLAKLAEEGLGNHDNVQKLGRELGFKPTEISLYIETNYSSGRVGTKGTVKLLFDWKKKTRKAEQVSTLRAALTRAGFEGLAEEYFPDSSSHPTDDSSPDLTSTSSTPDLMVTASQPMPDLASSSSSSPYPGTASVTDQTASVTDQTANPAVDHASGQLLQRGLHFCRMRRTSYTMDGFCLLYLLLILLMGSCDVETNPGPNTAVSPLSGKELLMIAQEIHPSHYDALGKSLGFQYYEMQAILNEQLKNYPNAFMHVFMKWNVMPQPLHTNRRQLLADKLRKLGLGGLSDRILNKPLIPNITDPLQGASSSQPQQTSHRSTEETQDTVSEEEFLKLAKAIHPSHYDAVGISLGIPYAERQAILSGQLKNYPSAFMNVFMKWNVMPQPIHTNRRQLLADKLRQLGLGGLSDRILNKPLIPNSTEPSQGASSSQPQQTSLRSTEETLENNSGRQEDLDKKLTTVARKIVKHEDIDCLGKALGFEPEDIERYVNTNMKNAHVSYMGTLSMLRDWRKKQTEATECEALKLALREAGQNHLAFELFGT